MSYDISHHTRLKPKKVSTFGQIRSPLKKVSPTSKGKATETDREFLGYLNDNRDEFKCMVCKKRGVEFHHVKVNSSEKKNHKRLIPLCREHHTGSNTFAVHTTASKFREIYPMEFQYILADKIYNNFLKVINV